MIDPGTYSELQALENAFNTEVNTMARGNLSSEKFAALPGPVQGLRKSIAGVKLGGSPMKNFEAQIQKMIDKGEEDHKILAVNAVEPGLSNINSSAEVNLNKRKKLTKALPIY